MSQMINTLRSKFSEFSIPSDIADNFLNLYRMAEQGLYPEIELSEVPSDDCFKTLQAYCNSGNKAPDVILMRKLLAVSYSQIETTKEKLSGLIDDADLERSYHNPDMYFVIPEFVDELQNCFENIGMQKINYMGCFMNALVLGSAAFERINGISALFDINTTSKIITQAAIWYPYSDPIGLIHYLLDHGLTKRQASQLLIEDPILIMYFRKEKTLRAGHNQEYIDCVIAKVKTVN